MDTKDKKPKKLTETEERIGLALAAAAGLDRTAGSAAAEVDVAAYDVLALLTAIKYGGSTKSQACQRAVDALTQAVEHANRAKSNRITLRVGNGGNHG